MGTDHLVHDLVAHSMQRSPDEPAIVAGNDKLSYAQLWRLAQRTAGAFGELGLDRFDRVAVYLPKVPENVASILAASLAGAAIVPINPVLKPHQVRHILSDSGARGLVTTHDRALALGLDECTDLRWCVTTGARAAIEGSSVSFQSWQDIAAAEARPPAGRVLETDIAAILYTSGSTGKPKGVVLSHRNIVLGAQSVAQYLENSPEDRILSILPLSFDAGFSQLTTAFCVGARVILLDYLLPQDVVRACAKHGVTGITGVPPLWMQLAAQDWSPEATQAVRYFANTGGKMPRDTLRQLREIFPNASPYLMYGLTEAFRSTYLPPDQVDARPDSIGKAIPSVEVMVVHPDGTPCAPGEPGELVHRGPLVAQGYWRDPERTAVRFRPAPGQLDGLPRPELAVWSGDAVRCDEDGYLYFIGRSDDMIKTSGYRVSPTEVEEVAFQSAEVAEAAAFGVPHARLGQAIVLVVKSVTGAEDTQALLEHYRRSLPAFMVPIHIEWQTTLPKNPNGKIDRKQLAADLEGLYPADGHE